METDLNYTSLGASWENTIGKQIEIKPNSLKYISKKGYNL